MPTVAFHTLGCKLNQYETEAKREQFEDNGYTVVPFSAEADVYVINTCTVTAKSDRSSRKAVYQALRRAANPRVAVTGCSARISPQSYTQIPGVAIVSGGHDTGRFFDLAMGRTLLPEAEDLQTGSVALDRNGWSSISRFGAYTRAFIKIQDGCDSACSYCIVPRARGHQRSRPLPEILSQARTLVEEGYQEIVLTGIHIGAYGRDVGGEPSLIQVLESLLDIPGLFRIRLSSIEPGECSPQLVSLIASSPRLCRHLHIPLQSGDDRILVAMNRRYRTGDFARLVEGLVTAIPDVGIGTDVIVGFPGETGDSFQRSLDFVERLPLSYLHVFNYSRRPGTTAASFPGQICPQEKKTRVRAFRRLRSEKIIAFGNRFAGRHLKVLLEHRRQRETGRLEGLSDNYIRLAVDGDASLQGQIVDVRLDKMTGECALGTVLPCAPEAQNDQCTMQHERCRMKNAPDTMHNA